MQWNIYHPCRSKFTSGTGAKLVLISAPPKTLEDCDAVLLKGINLENFDPFLHRIVSTGSCTTNGLAPVVKVVREKFGIQYGIFSTVHSYTNSQSLTDHPMKDRRDSWAAEKPCTMEEVTHAFCKAAAKAPLKGMMDVLEESWSSARIVGDSHSSIIDLRITQRKGGILPVASWYSFMLNKYFLVE